MLLAEATGLFRRPRSSPLSGPLLGERVGWRWLAVAIGMGVLIMVRPSGAAIQYVDILPLISPRYAGTQLITRCLGVTDRASDHIVYIQLTLLAASVMGLAVGDGRFAGGGH